MQKLKIGVFGIVVLTAIAVTALLVGTTPNKADAAPVVLKDHWRHHDGHWDYWHAADNRWYHTDGNNWYYNDGEAWKVYGFDKGFGREGFERGEYKVPGEGVKVVLPGHRVFRP